MGQYENTLYTESTMVVRDVTAAQWEAQKLNAPKHSGITYRVDGVAEYRWNGTDWDAVVKASVNDLTGGIAGLTAAGVTLSVAPLVPTVALLGDSLSAYNNYFITPSTVTRSSNVVTVNSAGHGFADKTHIRAFGFADTTFNSESVALTRVGANAFSYPSVGADGSAAIDANYTRILAYSWYSNVSPFLFANAILGGQLKLIANLGQSSETSAMILARVASVVTSGANECWVLAGSNDVVAATTAAVTKANLKSIYDYLIGYGVFVRAITIPPLGSSHANFSTATPKIHQINNWIRQYCKSHRGIALADVFSGVVDPASATGAARANALQSDNVHWQTYGAYLAGQKIASSYNGQLPPGDILTKSQADSYATNASNPNIWPGAPWAATGGSISDVVSGVAGAGFNVASAGNGGRVAVASVPSRSDGFGYDQQVVFTAAAASDTVTIQQQSAATLASRVAAGEQYVLRYALSVSGVSGSGLSYLRVRIQGTFGGTAVVLGTPMHSMVSGSNNVNTDLTGLVVESPVMTIPSGACTSLTVEWIAAFAAAGTALTIKVGRVSFDRVDADSQ